MRPLTSAPRGTPMGPGRRGPVASVGAADRGPGAGHPARGGGTDWTGADQTASDSGTGLGTETVDGDTEHIHRGHPGGWSQRRFQQRAENTWERNGGRVVEAAIAGALRTDASIVVVPHPAVLDGPVAALLRW